MVFLASQENSENQVSHKFDMNKTCVKKSIPIRLKLADFKCLKRIDLL